MIRLAVEPDRLNPILSSQSVAVQIERWIFNPLQDYNPQTLELEPILLSESPVITVGENGLIKLAMTIRPDAKWDNGTPVTGHDYLFSMKAALVPQLDNASWSTFVSQITNITVSPEDPQQIEVLVQNAYMQAEEIVTGFAVYPEYVYDSSGLLHDLTFQDLLAAEDLAENIQEDLHAFATEFNSERFSREEIIGSGAYAFVEWQGQQSITLQKKEDWWGRNSSHPLLKAVPQEIKYFFIPDEQTALTNLKDGGLDLVSEISPDQFVTLQTAADDGSALKLFTPAVLQYYYIAYNNDHPALSDIATRTAISHLMDLETLIAQLFYGQGLPTIGPIHPSKLSYEANLVPLAFDLDLARTLLTSAGWKDQNGDGILDRTIDGSNTSLRLRIFTTRSQLSQDVAVLLQQEAAKVGIAIEVVPMEFRTMLQDVRAGRFEMACLASRPPVGSYDPYPNWHSENIGPQGNNLCKFRNAAMDEVIQDIRYADSNEARTLHYKTFQRIIYQDQPALFLIAPTTRIALDGQYDLLTSSMRPGYFENSISAF